MIYDMMKVRTRPTSQFFEIFDFEVHNLEITAYVRRKIRFMRSKVSNNAH